MALQYRAWAFPHENQGHAVIATLDEQIGINKVAQAIRVAR